jgi:hypothetical protein
MTPDTERRTEPRSAWWAETGRVAALDFGLAITLEDFEGALGLVHDRYVRRGYMDPEASGLRLGIHHLLLSTKVFVARAARAHEAEVSSDAAAPGGATGSRVIGTLRIVEDSSLGLPMDDAFGVELGRLRDRGRRLAEAGALAFHPAYRECGVPILVRLLRLAILYATRIAGADDVCFAVHVRHRDFYLGLFPFHALGEPRPQPSVRVAQAAGLRLDLHLVRALIRTERAGLGAGPRASFLCGPAAYRQVMARLRQDLPRSTLAPPEWAGLFARIGAPGDPHGAPEMRNAGERGAEGAVGARALEAAHVAVNSETGGSE